MASDVDFLGKYTGAVGRLNAIYNGVKLISGGLNKTIGILGSMTKYWRDIQQSAFETARAVGLSRDKAMAYDRILMQSAKELGRQYGVTYKDIAKWQDEYVTRVGKSIIMNRRQQEALAAMARLAGGDTASQMVDEMNRFGGSIDEAEMSMALVQERAKSLGLSTKTASEALAKNMHLASTYQFKNGIDGLQRMVLASQRLRINMESITQVADGFQSIEGSIEKAAKLQVLGGTFAQQFSNPMGVLYESMNDIGALTKRIENSVKGLGTFNKKTGNVDINGLNQLMIKAAAEAMGMSRQELTQIVMSKAKESEVEGAIGKNGNRFNEAQEALIKNKAVWDAKQQTFVINDVDEHGNVTDTYRVDQLTQDQVKLLQDSNLTEEKLWGDVHKIREVITGEFRARARGTTSTNENIEGLQSEWQSMMAQFQNVIMGTVGSWYLNGATMRPWDFMRGISTPFGMFADGGIVDSVKDTEPVKAQFGAMIPGSSYSGDRVPVMANSGEMILNQEEQSGLWNLIKKAGKTAAMMYAGNKIGGKFGLKGIGTMIGLHSLMTGGEASVGQLAATGAGLGVAQLVGRRMYGASAMGMGSPMMGGMMGMPSPMIPNIGMRSPMLPMVGSGMMGMGPSMSLFNPNVFMNGNIMMNGGMMGGMGSPFFGNMTDSMLDFTDSVDLAKNKTNSFGNSLKDFSNKWSGRFMSNTRLGRGINRHVIARSRLIGRGIRNSGVGRFYSASAAKGRLIGSNLSNLYNRNVTARGRLFRTKINNSEFFKDFKGLFNGGATKAAQSTNAIGKVASKIGKNGKVLSSLGSVGKSLGRAAGPAALVLGGISMMSDISAANSQYREREREIENSDMSDIEKARAKDDAVREKNATKGSSIGGFGGAVAGASAGAAIGSVIPGIGTLVGGVIGGAVGAFGGGSLGKSIGGLFGGKNEKKLKEEKEKEKAKAFEASSKGGRTVDDVSRTVDNIYSYLISGKLSEVHGVSYHDVPKITKTSNGVIGGAFNGIKNAVTDVLENPLKLPLLGISTTLGAISGAFKSTTNVEPVMASKPIGERTYVSPFGVNEVKADVPTPTVKDINLNVSGTIKLDGNGGTNTSFNLDELIKDPTFVRKIKDMIIKSISETENGGRQNLENDRNNRLR